MELDHVIVPSRDRFAAAERLAAILDVPWSETGVGPFCPVFVSESLTLDFDTAEGAFPIQHYAFRVSDAEFDAIVKRLEAFGIAYRGGPGGPNDGRIGAHDGGRIVYWDEPPGHVWEALTVSYARRPVAAENSAASA